ncbi:fumarylacetoacetate hydrolase family protein [Hyphomonas sp.]|jgi:2-keto-4-pentenoate hydratase/2-oxohepta-3-ene-1,7-dioic acid hydratase in catechol pathway|uniref:fumarylacetoacetate hydrolase family protein n=1 Tax=Hyphomonas sp. TaxID=87 RepID=UPI0039E5A42E
MRLVRFEYEGVTRFGALRAASVAPLVGDTMEAALKADASGDPVPLNDVTLLAPVVKPGKILGIGVNYAAHAAESVSFIDTKKPEVQKWFNKQVTAVNGPYADVHLPKVSEQLDYEGELVVIIGKHGRHVPRERAFEIVAGVTIGCDYSVRDWQRASQTMIMGKGFDTHAVFGPAIVTLDEIDDLSALELRTFVNGESRQVGYVRDQIHDIAAQIAHLTAAFTLEPGDVIFTGTPAGVGAGHTPPKWLKAGDRVRVEIDCLGFIENEIVREPGETVIS